jgi:SAM-dependent methyltransferase
MAEIRMMQSDVLYRAEQLPVLQNQTFDTAEEARHCTRGDLVLIRDRNTGLIFNAAFNSELITYDRNYQNEQAFSPAFRTHLDEVTEIVSRHFSGQRLIEIGCGKGHFLHRLELAGFRITGLDPTYEGDSPSIIKGLFTPQIDLTADVIILRHVLEHVQDPVHFLEQVREANRGSGRIYIEVPCFDWICAHRAWFDIFYEHVNYFRASDFFRLFGSVLESGHLFGGQYLYVVADLGTLRTPACAPDDDFRFPENFLRSISQHAMRLNSSRKPALVWGASSKGVIFTLYMERAGAKIDHVVDINPAKQNRCLPATGLLIRAPEDALKTIEHGATIFVMNSNYLEEIRTMTKDQFNYVTVDHEVL